MTENYSLTGTKFLIWDAEKVLEGATGWLSQLIIWVKFRLRSCMTSWFIGLNPESGSVLTAWDLLGSLSALSPPHTCVPSLSNKL